MTVAADVHLKPGARLIREWRGKTHTVIVLEEGFAFEGKTYSSLARIAHLITGAHWSGPHFFGLNRNRAMNGDLSGEMPGSAKAQGATHG